MTALSIIINIVLILVSIVLIVAVLMQQGQRQGLGAIGGGAALCGAHGGKHYMPHTEQTLQQQEHPPHR